MFELITERLKVTHFSEADAPFVFELLNTPSWIKYIGNRDINSLEDARQYIVEKYFPNYEKYGFGAYKVSLKDSNKPIGTSGLFRRQGLEDMDAGFAFLPDYEGFGYAYEATAAILEHEKKHHDIQRILAITLPENQRSVNLLLRLGFKYDKIIRLPNEDVDLALYVM